MKQSVSPTVVIAVIAIAVVIVAGIGFWVWRAPSVPTTGAKTDAQGKTVQGPRAGGGGPDAEAFKKRDEYNRTHPGAAGSGTGSAGRRPF